MKLMKILPFIGLALFFYIMSKVDIGKIFIVLKDINWFYFVLAFALNFIVIWLKSIKWNIVIGKKHQLTSFYSFIYWLVGFGIGTITPGRIGDFYRAWLLKRKKKLDTGFSLSTTLIDRIIDIMILFFLTGISTLYLVNLFNISQFFVYMSLFLFAIAILCIFIFKQGFAKKLFLGLIKRIFRSKKLLKHANSFQTLFTKFFSRTSLVSLTILLGLFIFLITFIQMKFLVLALGLKLPFLFLSALTVFVNFMEALPISFSGFGTRDATILFFFSFYSILPELAIGLSLLYVLNIYLMSLIGLAFWTAVK